MRQGIALLLITILSLPILCFSQSDTRKNFQQAFWNNYVGVYSTNNNSAITISLTWGNKLVYTNLENRQFLPLSKKEDDLFASGDSLQVRFTRNKPNEVTSLTVEALDGKLEAQKVDIEFEELSIPSGNATISGTLIKPAGEEPFPAVIMNGGASWIVRDTNLDLALYHVSQGRAAFVYDKRGYGESTGSKTVPFQTTANDIKSIAEQLQYRVDINPQKIGISTYSQSGWYGTLASAQSDVISFQILNVASATTVERQERQRIKNELQADAFSNTEIQNALGLFDLMSTFSKTGTNWDEYITMRNAHQEKEWFNYLFAPKDNSKETWSWGRMNWLYNPLPALSRTTIPTLVLLGEKDQKVLAEVNKSIFEIAFRMAGNRNYKIKVIPDMNHGLETAYKGGRKEQKTYQYANGIFQIKEKWLQSILN